MASETFVWFHVMDSVITDRPAAATDITDQMTPELMVSDVKTGTFIQTGNNLQHLKSYI